MPQSSLGSPDPRSHPSVAPPITRLPNYPITRFFILFVVLAGVVAALARGLPVDVFYAGDPGVKLIAARHALAQPANPLEIPLPDVGGAPAPFVDPFFLIHGGHAHAVTPELFPLATAPLIALFGTAGAYVLPAAGLLLALAATAWLALVLDPRRSAAAVLLTAFLGTPLLFYGLELWEHAPAAGVAMLATALFVRASGSSSSAAAAFGAGLLLGVAALLRPEALLFAAAVLIASPLLRTRPTLRQQAAAAGGVAAALLPVAIYTVWHFGHPVPPHLAGNPGLVEGDWLATRRSVFVTWFVAQSKNNFWRVAPAVLLAFVWRPTSYFGGAARRGRPFLLAVAVVTTLLVVLTAPNDGGAQWGPRYLLLAYPPLAILATDTLWYVVRFVAAARPRSGAQRVFAGAAIGAVLVLAAGSAWLQRAAYKELRGAKLTYARLVDFVESHTAPGRAVVTDLWWLDQAAASIADSRRFLFVAGPDEGAAALRRLDAAREPAVTLIRSPIDSPGPYTDWLAGTCYGFAEERGSGEGLIAIKLVRSCGG